MQTILQFLRLNGEQLDADIAEALKLPLAKVRDQLQELSAKGDVMTCFVTRFRGGRKIEGWSCRPAGFIPPAAPGRKSSPAKS